jgi:Xaa-Pro dipeptidase
MRGSAELMAADTLLKTPNLGTGITEDRDRVDFTALRRQRTEKLFDWMDRLELDACVFGREANVRYATGARRLWTSLSRPFGPTCVAVRATREVHLLSFSASYEGIPAELQPDDVYAVTWNPMNLIAHLQGMEATSTAKRVGVDGLSSLFDGLLRLAFPQAEIVGIQPELLDLRRVKLPAEIDCLRIAAATAEAALVAAAVRVRAGVTGKDLQAAYLARMCELGTSQFAQQGTFNAFGPGGELAFATSPHPIDANAAVALAGGVLWAGYEGSLARTWWSGGDEPPAELHRMHEDWQHAFERVRAACRPGASGADLLQVLDAANADANHSAIYSIGLGHEGPIAAAWLERGALERQVLQADMVLGVRTLLRSDSYGYLAEDMVVVGPHGADAMTTLGYGPLAV